MCVSPPPLCFLSFLVLLSAPCVLCVLCALIKGVSEREREGEERKGELGVRELG